MRLPKKIFPLLLVAILPLFILPACHLDVAETHTTDYYHYNYYPSHDVYYDRQEHIYYYRHNNHWVRNRHLPSHYDIRNSRHHHLRMRHREPYHAHREWRRFEYFKNK